MWRAVWATQSKSWKLAVLSVRQLVKLTVLCWVRKQGERPGFEKFNLLEPLRRSNKNEKVLRWICSLCKRIREYYFSITILSTCSLKSETAATTVAGLARVSKPKSLPQTNIDWSKSRGGRPSKNGRWGNCNLVSQVPFTFFHLSRHFPRQRQITPIEKMQSRGTNTKEKDIQLRAKEIGHALWLY